MKIKLHNKRNKRGSRSGAFHGWGLVIASLVASCVSTSTIADAQDLSSRRRAGLEELRAAYLNKEFSIEATLVSQSGPEFLSNLFGKQLEGCPAPGPEAAKSFTTRLRVEGAGAWAGDFDGINTKVKSAIGSSGSGFAVPSRSSARLPEFQKGPELEFIFDGTQDVQRSLIEEALRRVDRCLSAVPVGIYGPDELARRCPYPNISREKVGQTCVPFTSGIISEPLADGSGYKVVVNQGTVCDFVGFKGQASNSTSFMGCYNQQYEGIARVVNAREGASALAKMATTAKRQCKRLKRKRSARSIDACVMRVMGRAMERSGR